jgi:hypothetical protein
MADYIIHNPVKSKGAAFDPSGRKGSVLFLGGQGKIRLTFTWEYKSDERTIDKVTLEYPDTISSIFKLIIFDDKQWNGMPEELRSLRHKILGFVLESEKGKGSPRITIIADDRAYPKLVELLGHNVRRKIGQLTLNILPLSKALRNMKQAQDVLYTHARQLSKPEGKDFAMVTPKGGIDLTPANVNLQIQNNIGEIKFHLDPAMLQQLQNAPGFVPVIINIQPMTDLRKFLGVKC